MTYLFDLNDILWKCDLKLCYLRSLRMFNNNIVFEEV